MARINPANWYPWRLDVESLVLVIKPPGACEDYEVDLETCLDSRAVLDWYHHLNEKDWFTHNRVRNNRVRNGFAIALMELVHPEALNDEVDWSITAAQLRSAVMLAG
jgi:hypothetical protein